jgi:hypothetical protein
MPALPVAQAALALGWSEDTVRRRVKSRRLESSTDPLGRLLVMVNPADVVEDIGTVEITGRSAADANGATPADLRSTLAQLAAADARAAALERERDLLAGHVQTLTAELDARRGEVGDLVRALHQQQLLHARSAGIPLLSAGGEVVVDETSVRGQQRRAWWRRRRPGTSEPG